MNPKEKAAELLMKFQNVEALKDYGGMDFEIARQCALIAVEECINSLHDQDEFDMELIEYWIKVGSELENLKNETK